MSNPYIERMHTEHEELSKRIRDLTSFIQSNPLFTELDYLDKEALREQLSHMNKYKDTLFKRIARAIGKK